MLCYSAKQPFRKQPFPKGAIHVMIPVVLFFQSATAKSWQDKIVGVYRFAQRAGWQVQVVNAHGKRAEITEALDLWQPIGCIVDRAMTRARNPIKLFRDIPIALLDQNPATATGTHPSVTHDSAAAARLAAQELLGTGAVSFTYIPWHEPAFWCAQREAAFAKSIRAAKRRYVRWTGDFAALPKPCGVLCANDLTAQRAMRLAAKSGWRIPEDLLFIGIDNDELICNNLTPTLTSILPDFEQAGYTAAQLLKDAIDGKPPRHTTYGPVGLVRRASSRWLEKSNPRVTAALAYIQKHAFEPTLKTDAIVREMGCSRRLADLRFREVTHRSIRDEIHAVRMERAFSLLRNRNQDIGSVASLCGYASEPFFKRLFKRETGLTMREWRKRFRPQ